MSWEILKLGALHHRASTRAHTSVLSWPSCRLPCRRRAHICIRLFSSTLTCLFSLLCCSMDGINLFVRAVCPGEGWSQTALKAGAQSLHPTENPISQGPGENFYQSSASHSCSPLCSVTATPLLHPAVQPCN